MNSNILSNLVVLNVKSANRIYAKPNTKAIRKNRECWGLAIKHIGYTEYMCNGIKFMSDSNHITILPKGSSYSWESYGGECLIIDFDANIDGYCIYSFEVKDSSKLVSLFNKIEKNRVSSNTLEIKNLQYLYEMLTTLMENDKKEYIPANKEDIIAPSIKYINENFNNPDINLELLSDISGVSYVYFRKLFSKLYGIPPMEYISKLRMNKAAEILKSDYDSIESVALSVGYKSIYHFSKMFKKHFGMSPSSFN